MSSHECSMKLISHGEMFSQVFVDFLKNEKYVDVTLACQGQSLKAHKMVLAAFSPYLQGMFDSIPEYEPQEHQIIMLDGYHYDDIRAIVDFIYSGELVIGGNNTRRILDAASDLQIKGLLEVCPKSRKPTTAPAGVDDDADDEEREGGGTLPKSSSAAASRSFWRSNEPEAGEKPYYRKFRHATTTDSGKRVMSETFVVRTTKRGRKVPLKDDAKLVKSFHDRSGNTQGNDAKIYHANVQYRPAAVRKNNGPVTAMSRGAAMLGKIKGRMDADEEDMTKSAKNKIPAKMILKTEATAEPIMRPPDAFMVFSNQYRRQFADQFPDENDYAISIRLGIAWTNLDGDMKEAYFAASRQRQS